MIKILLSTIVCLSISGCFPKSSNFSSDCLFGSKFSPSEKLSIPIKILLESPQKVIISGKDYFINGGGGDYEQKSGTIEIFFNLPKGYNFERIWLIYQLYNEEKINETTAIEIENLPKPLVKNNINYYSFECVKYSPSFAVIKLKKDNQDLFIKGQIVYPTKPL